MKYETLDNKDLEILNILKEDCRKSFSDIGKEVGLSRVAVKNRIESLEDRKVIRGYKAIIDKKGTANAIEFYMDIEVDPMLYDEVIEGLAANPVIKRITGTTGESRLHVTGNAIDKNTMEKYTKSLFYQLRGIRRISIHTVYSVLYDEEIGVEYEKYKGESK